MFRTPTDATAQPATKPVAFELRLGALWPQPPLVLDQDDAAPSTSSFTVGGRFGYNFAGLLGGRLGLHVLGDYALRLGSIQYTEAGLGLVSREGHWFVLTPAIAVDLLKTSRVVAGVRAGPSLVAELTTFGLQRSSPSCTVLIGGVVSCEGPFENVCDLKAFEDRCNERYRAALALGGGMRWHPGRSPLYFGVDYTWLTIHRNVLVGTIGLATRE
jgi:hypothetical protein